MLVTPIMMTEVSDVRYFANEGLALSWYCTLPAKIAIEDVSGVRGIHERILVRSKSIWSTTIFN